MRSIRSPSLPRTSPVPKSIVCRAVRTTTAVPRPTSSTSSATDAGGTAQRGDVASGRQARSPEARNGHGSGSRSATAAGRASRYHQPAGVTAINASGQSAAAASQGQPQPCSHSAAPSGQIAREGVHRRVTTAASASGTRAKVKKGIAAKFTTSPARDSLPKRASVAGTSPTNTASCTRSALAAIPDASTRVPVVSRMTPTAMKESQKPGASGARKSMSSTATSATANTLAAPAGRAP